MFVVLVAEQAAQAAGGSGGLMGAFKERPTFLVANLVVSAVVIAMVIERIAFQLSKYSVNSKEFFAQIKKLVAAGNIDRAIKLCDASDYPILQLVKAGLTHANKGGDEIASVRVASDQTVSYGITADNPAFEQVMRVLKFVANSTTLSSADITGAESLIESATDAVSTVWAKLSNADAQVKSAQSLQVDYQNFAQALDSNLTGVDVAAVTAQLATYQAQLSASFSALAKIQSLNLASFLR